MYQRQKAEPTNSRFRVQAVNRHRLTTDGEGVTTVVALYGCPLSCKYCINQKALQKPVWKEYTREELWKLVAQDYCYFIATGGGITFGGGESLLHADAIREFQAILPEGIYVTLETSLWAEVAELDKVLPAAKGLIIDIKTMNPKLYEAYTGQTNEKVLENLNYIVSQKMQDKCKIRIPYIAGYNDEADVQHSVNMIQNMGYTNIEVFSYRVPE